MHSIKAFTLKIPSPQPSPWGRGDYELRNLSDNLPSYTSIHFGRQSPKAPEGLLCLHACRYMPQAMVAPLARQATPGGEMTETPNRLIIEDRPC